MEKAAGTAGDSPVLQWSARLGFVASGIIHLVMGWIVLEVACGSTGQSADQTGALANLAGSAMGLLLLCLVTISFALLALWHVTEAFGRRAVLERLQASWHSPRVRFS